MKTMDAILERARVTLTSALNEPEVLTILSQYGYNFEKVHEGLALCEAAERALRTQHNSQHDKKDTTKAFQQRLRVAKMHYNLDLRCARLRLKEYPEVHGYLQLNGDRAESYEGWHYQAKNFYLGLQSRPHLLEAVATMGLTSERIVNGIDRVQELETIIVQRNQVESNTKGAQLQREQLFQSLNNWMVAFRGVARVALAPNPAYLFLLGLKPIGQKRTKSDGSTPENSVANMPEVQATANNMDFVARMQ